MPDTFRVHIYTPEKIAFEDEAVESLVLQGLDGEVGVMAHHMPAILALSAGTLRIKKDGEWRSFLTTEGFVDVNYNRAYVFVDLCVAAEHAGKAAAELERLKAKDRSSVREHRRNAVTLARVIADLRKKDPGVN